MFEVKDPSAILYWITKPNETLTNIFLLTYRTVCNAGKHVECINTAPASANKIKREQYREGNGDANNEINVAGNNRR